jgi:tetratricopeptide (TPR) repeat protein
LDVQEGSGEIENLAATCSSLAFVYRRAGRFDEAERMQRRSLEINERLGRLQAMASDYQHLGEIYKARGEVSLTRSMWTTALELYTRTGAATFATTIKNLLDTL